MDFLDVILKFLALFSVTVGGLWAITRYVIERGLVPAAELFLECGVVGEKDGQKIIEVTVHIVNKGSSILAAKDVRLILKAISSDDKLRLYRDDKKLGRLMFPCSLSRSLVKDDKCNERKAFTLVPHNTFVQPGVDQEYSFVTSINQSVEFIHAHAEFQYAQEPKNIQRGILWLSRKIGLIQYSLQNIYMPHTVQKAFNVSTSGNLPVE